MSDKMWSRCLVRFVLYITILLVVDGCSSPQLVPSPTPGSALPPQSLITSQTPNLTATVPELIIQPTPSWTPLPELTKLPSATQAFSATPKRPWSSFASLSPGQYLVYFDTEAEKGGLYVISQSGSLQQYLTDAYIYPSSIDGRKVVAIVDKGEEGIWDLEDNFVIELPFAPECTTYNLSPDLRMMAMECHGEIYVLSLDNRSSVIVANIADPNERYFFPLWSPDGRWIAMLKANVSSHVGEGLYLIDTSCLPEPNTCATKMLGPFQDNLYLQGPYVWSPDSQKLALPARSDDYPIKIFDIKTQTFRNLISMEGYGTADSFAWSPDGMWIAYGRREAEATSSTQDIFLVPAKGGKSLRLLDSTGSASVEFWLTVPWPFKPGDTYKITREGANLNLRQLPTTMAKILKKLQPDTLIRILSGPVDADGYHWWQMLLVEDNIEGWAVEHPDWFEPVTP